MGITMRLWGNDYNKMEFAGAFGDLGTLIPFVVGYITLNKMDPLGILVAFGLFKIFVGLYFRTPVPIQPMKAIGGMAIAHPEAITHGMIWGSGIFTGLFWLLMGLTGAITWIEKITTKPVVRGIMLGLGLSFVVEGLGMMRGEPLFAIGGVIITLLLLDSKRLYSKTGFVGRTHSYFHSVSTARIDVWTNVMARPSRGLRHFRTPPGSSNAGECHYWNCC